MGRRTVALAVVACCALLAAGCGDATPDSTGEPTDATPFQRAYQATVRAGTASATLTVVMRVPGKTMYITGTGQITFRPRAERFHDGDYRIVTIDGDELIDDPASDGSWSPSRVPGFEFDEFPMPTPSELAVYYPRGVSGPVRSTGTTTIHGTRVTGYRGTTHLDAVVRAQQNAEPGSPRGLLKQVDQWFTAFGVSTTPRLDIWTGSAGRLVRLRTGETIHKPGGKTVFTLTITVDLARYGRPVAVTRPSPPY